MSEPAQKSAEVPFNPQAALREALESAEETLLQKYNKYFYSCAADTPELLTQSLMIRFQVYCLEHGFENPDDHPDGREADEYDPRSVHSLLLHRETKNPVGTVRLVLHDPKAPQDSFAMQRVFEPGDLDYANLFPIKTTGEVSRFSISKNFRRRQGDGDYAESADNNRSFAKRSGPLLSLGLIQALVRMTVEQGITHWCAMMEPKLLRMLAGFGIYFEPLGPPVEFHGLRQPCYNHVDTLLKRCHYERPDYHEVITDGGRLW